MAGETKNQAGWKAIESKTHFTRHIEEHGEFHISAPDIKRLSGREPRLMAKFDHSINRPDIFRKNNISILPVTGSSYKLYPFDSYCPLPETEPNPRPIKADILNRFQSIDPFDIRSEDKTLIVAHISGMLAAFCGEESLSLTARGKFGTGDFSFYIRTAGGKKKVDTHGTGAELDAGFEGDRFYVIEAKMGKCSDFNIRQLYYPYRFWKERIKKDVVPVFLEYSDNTFRFREFCFHDPGDFNSIELVKQAEYYIDIDPRPDIRRILEGISTCYPSDPPGIPFPQADDFEKVINIVELVHAGFNEKEDFADYFAFDKRQADYYFNAARYLGLVDKNKETVRLTRQGREVAEASRNKRHTLLIRTILLRKVFYDTFLSMEKEPLPETENKMITFMANNNVLTESTEYMRKRRSRTIISWCRWISNIL